MAGFDKEIWVHNWDLDRIEGLLDREDIEYGWKVAPWKKNDPFYRGDAKYDHDGDAYLLACSDDIDDIINLLDGEDIWHDEADNYDGDDDNDDED